MISITTAGDYDDEDDLHLYDFDALSSNFSVEYLG